MTSYSAWDIFSGQFPTKPPQRPAVLTPHHLAMWKNISFPRSSPGTPPLTRNTEMWMKERHEGQEQIRKSPFANQRTHRNFKTKHGVHRMGAMSCWVRFDAIFLTRNDVHNTPEKLEKAMKEKHHSITFHAHAGAAITKRPVADGQRTAKPERGDTPRLKALAQKKTTTCRLRRKRLQETGQTLIKTVLAPAFQTACCWASERLVFHQHSRQPRQRSPRGSALKDQGRIESSEPWTYILHRISIEPYKKNPPTGAHSTLPARRDNKNEGWDKQLIFFGLDRLSDDRSRWTSSAAIDYRCGRLDLMVMFPPTSRSALG